MSGFNDSQLAFGLVGFALLIAGFVSHLIIGNLFGVMFDRGEVIVGFILFGIGLLAFMASWIFDPRFELRRRDHGSRRLRRHHRQLHRLRGHAIRAQRLVLDVSPVAQSLTASSLMADAKGRQRLV